MSTDEDRLRKLRAGKLAALARAQLGLGADVEIVEQTFGDGAALEVAGALWVLAGDQPERALGRALVLVGRSPVAALHLVHDDAAAAAIDARRAAMLTVPVHVWVVAGTALQAATPAPLPIPDDPPAGPEVAAFVALLQDTGVEVVVESGVITGEVRGLEVARVRVLHDGSAVLDVGVGRFDQEATALLHADTPTREALVRAATMLRELRRSDAPPHPVNRLARERWLRAQVIDEPALVGLDALAPISPPQPRKNVKEPWPAAALGHRPSGVPVLVVCTAGVDLAWLPFAAELLERERPGEVVVVLPPRDLLPVQHRLAALLPVPVSFVALDGGWPV